MINIDIFASEAEAQVKAAVYRGQQRNARVDKATGLVIQDHRNKSKVMDTGDTVWIVYVT